MKFLWNSGISQSASGLLSFIPSICFLLICNTFYLKFQSAKFSVNRGQAGHFSSQAEEWSDFRLFPLPRIPLQGCLWDCLLIILYFGAHWICSPLGLRGRNFVLWSCGWFISAFIVAVFWFGKLTKLRKLRFLKILQFIVSFEAKIKTS